MIKFLWTFLKHKWYVMVYGRRLRVSMWQLLTHDLSKLSPSEFGGYVELKGEKFAHAWAHHKLYNKHHWEYWLGSPMPERYIREMVADWMAASQVYRGEYRHPRYWWIENKHKIHLHTWSKLKLLEILNEI